ncbi:hypothetical protein FZEAL_11007, partial [Fusarium zealandicum]
MTKVLLLLEGSIPQHMAMSKARSISTSHRNLDTTQNRTMVKALTVGLRVLAQLPHINLDNIMTIPFPSINTTRLRESTSMWNRSQSHPQSRCMIGMLRDADFERHPPPADSKPEAMNFPSTHYEMSRDTTPFVPPERY